jgi:DNA-directed RNA polymerase subunit RPC12/RpoP
MNLLAADVWRKAADQHKDKIACPRCGDRCGVR